MLKFTGAFLLAAVALTNTAEAKIYNQWLLQPQKNHGQITDNQKAKESSALQQKRTHIRLINAKDPYNKLILSCKANSGVMHLSAVIGDKFTAADSSNTVKGEKRQKGERFKRQKTLLTLLIDDKSVLKDNPAFERPERRHGMAVVTMIKGDAMTNFISRFLAAKKNITVSYGNHGSQSFSVTNNAQAGAALQNCLYK